jgi:hypothetical protein
VKRLPEIMLVSWLSALALFVAGIWGACWKPAWTHSKYAFPTWWVLFTTALGLPVLVVKVAALIHIISFRFRAWREDRRRSMRY